MRLVILITLSVLACACISRAMITMPKAAHLWSIIVIGILSILALGITLFASTGRYGPT